MKSHVRSLRVGGSIQWLVNASAALWACTWAPIEYRRRLHQKAATAAGANEAVAEYANDADQEKAEDGHPKVVVKPCGGSPGSSEYADGYQADPEKPIPPAQLVPDRHRLSTVFRTVHRCAEAQAAMKTPLRPPNSKNQNAAGEADKPSASGATNGADVGQIDNAAQEPRAESDGAERCPRTVLSVVTKHTDRGKQERHDHDFYPVSPQIDEFSNGHSHGLKFYPAPRIAP
jgi:hypothetical protein